MTLKSLNNKNPFCFSNQIKLGRRLETEKKVENDNPSVHWGSVPTLHPSSRRGRCKNIYESNGEIIDPWYKKGWNSLRNYTRERRKDFGGRKDKRQYMTGLGIRIKKEEWSCRIYKNPSQISHSKFTLEKKKNVQMSNVRQTVFNNWTFENPP